MAKIRTTIIIQFTYLVRSTPSEKIGWKTFDHWFIWNIPPTVNEIPEGTVPPEAIQGLNGAGSEGYIGACPPNGTHRYFFKLFALNKKLDVSPNISKQQLENEIKNNMIDKAELIGLYQKHNGPQR